jgi:hypothetical protein
MPRLGAPRRLELAGDAWPLPDRSSELPQPAVVLDVATVTAIASCKHTSSWVVGLVVSRVDVMRVNTDANCRRRSVGLADPHAGIRGDLDEA